MNLRKRFRKLLNSPQNVRFGELVQLAEGFGFRLHRVSSSHHIYGRAGIAEQLNLQNVGAKAKAYQVRQFLKLVERYNLELPEE